MQLSFFRKIDKKSQNEISDLLFRSQRGGRAWSHDRIIKDSQISLRVAQINRAGARDQRSLPPRQDAHQGHVPQQQLRSSTSPSSSSPPPPERPELSFRGFQLRSFELRAQFRGRRASVRGCFFPEFHGEVACVSGGEKIGDGWSYLVLSCSNRCWSVPFAFIMWRAAEYINVPLLCAWRTYTTSLI